MREVSVTCGATSGQRVTSQKAAMTLSTGAAISKETSNVSIRCDTFLHDTEGIVPLLCKPNAAVCPRENSHWLGLALLHFHHVEVACGGVIADHFISAARTQAAAVRNPQIALGITAQLDRFWALTG